MRSVVNGLAYEDAPEVTIHTDLTTALSGADFVFSAMRVGGPRGRVIDERVALDEGVLGQETVGPGGYAYAFRTIPEALRLAEAVQQHAPDAWVINFTNPAGMITQTMRTVLGARVVGICDTPIGLVRRVCRALGVDPGEVDRAGSRVSFDYAGINHLGWLTAFRVDGTDRLPGLIADTAALATIEEARMIGGEWVRALGVLPSEYLFYYYSNREAVERIKRDRHTRGEFLVAQQGKFYRDAAAHPERAADVWLAAHREREATYMAESRDTAERDARREEDIAAGGYQRVALDLMTALVGATGRRDNAGEPGAEQDGAPGRARMILNVGNGDLDDGRGLLIPSLRADAVVEVPCVVDHTGVTPERVCPPQGAELGLVQAVKACEELVIDAVRERSRELAWRALASHPLVDSTAVARRMLDGYIREHPHVAALFADELRGNTSRRKPRATLSGEASRSEGVDSGAAGATSRETV